MTEQRSNITAETVLQARYEDDVEDARTTNVVVGLGLTRSLLGTFSPNQWEDVAGYLINLLGKAPLKSSTGYEPHRVLLGAFATELRTAAHDAGVPVGTRAELERASTSAEERRLMEKLADEFDEYDRDIDDAIASTAPVLEEPVRHRVEGPNLEAFQDPDDVVWAAQDDEDDVRW